MHIAPDAELDDGLLDVVLIAAHVQARASCASCPGSSRARTCTIRRVRVLRGREVHVDADRPFTVYADGDPIGELPVTIRVVPDALRVLAPR